MQPLTTANTCPIDEGLSYVNGNNDSVAGTDGHSFATAADDGDVGKQVPSPQVQSGEGFDNGSPVTTTIAEDTSTPASLQNLGLPENSPELDHGNDTESQDPASSLRISSVSEGSMSDASPGASPPDSLSDNETALIPGTNCHDRTNRGGGGGGGYGGGGCGGEGGGGQEDGVSIPSCVQDPQGAKSSGDQSQMDISSSKAAAMPDPRVVWGSSLFILTCYVISLMTLPTLSTQYLNYKIGKDDYNYSFSPGHRETECHNSSTEDKDLINQIQRETSEVVLVASLACGIPSSLTCLVVGSYSDFLGRRPLIIASVLGGAVRIGSLAATIYYDLPVQVFYLGSFVDGALGSYFTLALAVTAVIADITPVPEARALRFAVVEGTLFTAGALAQLAMGFMIKAWDYSVPSAVTTSIMVLALIVTILCLPETMRRRNNEHFRWNPTLHLRKVFGFYFIRTPDHRRTLYVIGLAIFFFLMLTNLGRANVETLFVMNTPICWNPIDIGVYQSLRLMLCSVTAIIVLKLLKYRLSLEATGVICGLSALAGFIVESIATSGAEMYLAGIVGLLYLTAIPIPRAILSQITSPSEQGALFSSLAFVETAGSMFASLVYTLIYNATLNTFKGAVFAVMAALCFMNICCLSAYWWVRTSQSLLMPAKEAADLVIPAPPSTISSTSASADDDGVPQGYTRDNGGVKFRQNGIVTGREVEADEKTPLLMA